MKQRNYEMGDCGIACVAMITGQSYDAVHAVAIKEGLQSSDGTYYTTHSDIQRLLQKLGIPTKRRKFTNMREVVTPSIVKVNPRENGYRWHWVVLARVSGSLVLLDPNPSRPAKILQFSGYKGCGQYVCAAA